MFTKCFLMNFHRILDVCNSFFIHNHSWNDSRLVSNHSQLYGYSIPVAHRPMAQEFIEFWFFSGYLKNSSHPQYQHLVIFRRILLGLLDTICNFDFMIVVNKTQSFFLKKQTGKFPEISPSALLKCRNIIEIVCIWNREDLKIKI